MVEAAGAEPRRAMAVSIGLDRFRWGVPVAEPVRAEEWTPVEVGIDLFPGRKVENALGEIADQLAVIRREWAATGDRAALRRALHRLLCLLD